MIEINAGVLSKFIGRYSLGRDFGNGSSHFLRIKIPGGRLNSRTLIEIAELSDEFGRGYAEITDRQDIQLHWIDPDSAIEIFERLYSLGLTTDLCGQGFREACHGDVRNVVCCPLMGRVCKETCKDFCKDFSSLVYRISKFFSGGKYTSLPHKFKIAISACGEDCVKLFANDLSLYWDGDGFIPFVGGGMGASMPGVRFAESLGIRVPPERAFEFVKAVIDIHRKFSNTESKNKARFKYLVYRWGIEEIKKELERKLEDWGEFEEIQANGEVNDKIKKVKSSGAVEHTSGIQFDGRYYFTLPVLGGVLNSEKLRLIAFLSEKHGSGELRLTAWQNLVFLDVEGIDALKSELSSHFNLNIPYRAVGCASDFCGKTLVHSKQILASLSQGLGGLSLAISGCANGCACHPLADIGLVGKIKRAKQLFDVYFRGELVKKDVPSEMVESAVKEVLNEVKA